MTNTLKWGLFLGMVGTAAFAQADSAIRSVTHKSLTDGRQEVIVRGDNLAAPKVIRVVSKSSYILEFDANLRTDRGSVQVNRSGVSTVQYGWYSARPPKVRVALRLTQDITPELGKRGDDWIITFGVATPVVTKAPAPTAKPVVKPTAQPLPVKTDGAPALAYTNDALPLPGEPGSADARVKMEEMKGRSRATSASEGRFDSSIWGDAPMASSTTKVREVQKVKSETALSPVPTATTKVVSNTVTATQEAALSPAPTAAGMAQMVSLDFVGTDIIQILKALSIQSNVNIVASPEVSPADKPVKLTVSLNRVSLDDALSYITAISGLRYARVGNTYIVTPAANFSEAMRSVMERTGNKYDTRVVNLISGQAEKIREAALKAMAPAGRNGYYEIIIPTAGSLPGLNVTPNATGQAPDSGAAPQAAPAPAPAQASGRTYYLMIVGDATRLNEVETYIRDLDRQISQSGALNRVDDLATVVIPVQSGETGRIRTMLDRLIVEHPRAAEFTINESILEGAAKGDVQTMTLLMIGPKEEVRRLESFAKALDKELCAVIGKSYEADLAGLEKVFEVVELMYVEPSLVELDLKTRFKGVQFSLMPDAVTPGITGKTSSSESNTGATGDGGGEGGDGGAASDGGQEQSGESRSEERTITGREPMRIVLRGTKTQIEEAKRYIALIDVAPKQIALELRVMELTKEEALRIGIDWNAITGGRLSPIRVNQGLGDQPATSGTISGGYEFDPNNSVNFLATLDKLNSGRNLIARPNALVSDGRETNLFVGDTVRYIKTIQSTQNGTTVETDEVQVGVTFNIKARVGGNGQIALSLDQNFSILTGFTPVPGGGQLPQTSDRLTNMFVNMQSGETMAIGGLILDQDRKKYNGIPLLKDLPIIGQLFSRTDNQRVRTEIVFFLTANLVDATNRSNAASPGTASNRVPDPLGDYQRDRAPKGKKDDRALR